MGGTVSGISSSKMQERLGDKNGRIIWIVNKYTFLEKGLEKGKQLLFSQQNKFGKPQTQPILFFVSKSCS